MTDGKISAEERLVNFHALPFNDFSDRIWRLIKPPYAIASDDQVAAVDVFVVGDLQALHLINKNSVREFGALFVVPNISDREFMRTLVRQFPGAEHCGEIDFLEKLEDVYKVASREQGLDVRTENPGFRLNFSRGLEVVIDPDVSPSQAVAVLTAIADYYRVCGGIGLSAEFEPQESVTEEVHA